MQCLMLLFVLSLFALPAVGQATVTVNTTADTSTASDGACTLREALTNANNNSDTTSADCAAGSGADRIAFNIDTDADSGCDSSTGVCMIEPATPLPAIMETVILDGATQPDNADICTRAIHDRPPYQIVLDGADGNRSGILIWRGASNNTVGGRLWEWATSSRAMSYSAC